MQFKTHLVERMTRLYVQLLHVMFACSPSVAIVYLAQFQNEHFRFENHIAHEVAIAAATLHSAFITYITWRCYRDSGEPLLRWLTLAFLGFTVIYAPHGFFTLVADHQPLLFALYGPAARLVMNACLLFAILQFGKPVHPPARRDDRAAWGKALLLFVGINLLVGGLALSSLPGLASLRLVLEILALLCALGCLGLIMRRSRGLPLFAIYALAVAMFAQSSVAFLLSSAWNPQWWLAHAIGASGFMVLSYGVIRAFQTTRSFATVYSQEVVMRQMEQANAQLTRIATTDALTGVANRRHFLERLDGELARSERYTTPCALLLLDLDHFKQVNDSHGHQAGDAVLCSISRHIEDLLRTSDLFGRLGGEEFGILLPETSLREAIFTAERIRERVATLDIPAGNHLLNITISIGIASYPATGNSVETLYAEADRQLYAAKAAGRNRVSPATAT